jgi:hypothetical protein
MEHQLDDTQICKGVDCTYSLWDEQHNRYVPAKPVRLYEMTQQQAFNALITSLETGSPLALNPGQCAYADVRVKHVEIPDDIAAYLAEHPGMKLNPASPVTQRVLRLRMLSRNPEAEVLTEEQRQQRDWLHWQG